MAVLGSLEAELLLAEAEFSGISGSMSPRSSAYGEVARKVEYLRNRMRIRLTSGDSLSLFPGLDSIPSMLKEYENLSIDLEIRQLIYFMLMQEVETLRLEEAKDSPTVEILAPAVAQALRSYPKRAVAVVTNTFVAFLICLMWLAVVTYTRQLLKDESTGPFWTNIIHITRSQLFLLSKKRKKLR
jgi:capsule polysaccharide export protein KpsE/RkpR